MISNLMSVFNEILRLCAIELNVVAVQCFENEVLSSCNLYHSLETQMLNYKLLFRVNNEDSSYASDYESIF